MRMGFWTSRRRSSTKSTPEGARDYLVPSRVHPGEFFALPQSPQLFKQILMVAGMDRYIQICKCFRDEDLRADRQPEFTQVDVEMSFARPGDDLRHDRAADGGISSASSVRKITTPFRAHAVREAIAVYGSDKPDLRPGMPIQDVGELFRESSFGVFKKIVADGGTVRVLVVPNAGGLLAQRRRRHRRPGEGAGAPPPVVGAARRRRTITQLVPEGGGRRGPCGSCSTRPERRTGELAFVVGGGAECGVETLGQLRLTLAQKGWSCSIQAKYAVYSGWWTFPC